MCVRGSYLSVWSYFILISKNSRRVRYVSLSSRQLSQKVYKRISGVLLQGFTVYNYLLLGIPATKAMCLMRDVVI